MTKKDFFRGLLALAAIPMTMASCSSDDGGEPAPNPTPSEAEYVTINSVGVCDLNSRAEVAATDSYYQKLLLWFDSGRDDARYNASCMPWTASSSSPQYTPYDGSTLLWGGGSAKYVALTGSSGWTTYIDKLGGSVIRIEIGNQWALCYPVFIDDTHFVYSSMDIYSSSFYDLLIAQGTTTSSALNIQVKHATAKVVFKTNHESTYVSGLLHNVYSSAIGTIDVENGVQWDFSYYAPATIESSSNLGKNGEVVFYLLPQTVDNLIFQFDDIDGAVLVFDNPQTFEANKVYEYNVVVGDSNAELTGLSVSTWDDVESAGSFITE